MNERTIKQAGGWTKHIGEGKLDRSYTATIMGCDVHMSCCTEYVNGAITITATTAAGDDLELSLDDFSRVTEAKAAVRGLLREALAELDQDIASSEKAGKGAGKDFIVPLVMSEDRMPNHSDRKFIAACKAEVAAAVAGGECGKTGYYYLADRHLRAAVVNAIGREDVPADFEVPAGYAARREDRYDIYGIYADLDDAQWRRLVWQDIIARQEHLAAVKGDEFRYASRKDELDSLLGC